MRTFDSGATRDTNDDKYDYSGFLSPSAIKVFAAYMHKHRVQADGSLRASDNWKKGIPIPAYFESWIRHTIDFWDAYERGDLAACDDLACAIWFNMQGFLHERVKINGSQAASPVGPGPNWIDGTWLGQSEGCTHDQPCSRCREGIEQLKKGR